jgi:hypothetical protein
VLDAAHVHRILGQTPEPFATREKIASLAHSEPKGVLISHDVDRADQCTFNEEALETLNPFTGSRAALFQSSQPSEGVCEAQSDRTAHLRGAFFLIPGFAWSGKSCLGERPAMTMSYTRS